MKVLKKEELENSDKDSYVWYACYGSNINYDRFLKYIFGDKSDKYSMKTGCSIKDKPKEKHKYIINYPIYFANNSKTWNSSVAFLDYKGKGKSYGKIYKIKLSQFLDIYNQENRYLDYSAIILLDTKDNIPIYTFTSKIKQKDIKYPNVKYRQTILRGIKSTYKNLNYRDINKYFKTCTI